MKALITATALVGLGSPHLKKLGDAASGAFLSDGTELPSQPPSPSVQPETSFEGWGGLSLLDLTGRAGRSGENGGLRNVWPQSDLSMETLRLRLGFPLDHHSFIAAELDESVRSVDAAILIIARHGETICKHTQDEAKQRWLVDYLEYTLLTNRYTNFLETRKLNLPVFPPEEEKPIKRRQYDPAGGRRVYASFDFTATGRF